MGKNTLILEKISLFGLFKPSKFELNHFEYKNKIHLFQNTFTRFIGRLNMRIVTCDYPILYYLKIAYLLVDLFISFKSILTNTKFLMLRYDTNNCTLLVWMVMMEYAMYLAIDKFTKIARFNKRDIFFVFLSIFIDVPYFGTYVTIALAYRTEIVRLMDAINRITDVMGTKIYSIEMNGIRVKTIEMNTLNQTRNATTKKLHILIELQIFG